MKTITTTIVATMCVHDERPAMDSDERSHLEGAVADAVRNALSDGFLQHEPLRLGAIVTNVTVSFSGHVTD